MDGKKQSALALPNCQSPRGFALVITLTLMILLSVLALGLISLSTISLRGSSRDSARLTAEANARMGMFLAIGRLQELAGNDRRVTAAADLKMDSSASHGSRYWTGVWSNTAGDAASSEAFTKTPVAQFQGWLVSGPADELSTPDTTTVSLANGTTLVGTRSVGDSTPEHVTVPLVDIAPDAGGLAGRYGWWVGDEGVKTRGNLPSSANPALAATDLTLGERGGGWETINGFEGFPERGAPNEPTLVRALTFPTTSLAEPSVRNIAHKHFHGLTVDSRGLLTNTLAGGLRLDLTSYIENGFPATPASTPLPNAPMTGRNILPTSVAPNIKGPTWDRLRALRTMKPTSGGALTVAMGNDGDRPHISPIILDVRLLMGAMLKPVPRSDTQYRIYPCGKISVALANPYPYPLRWTRNLELEVVFVNGNGAASSIWDAAGRPRFLPETPSTPSVFGNAVFSIPAGELAPGEAQAYTMTGQVNRPRNTNRISVPLGPFLAQGPSDFRKSIILEHEDINTGSKLLDVREAVNTSVIAIELRGGGSGSGVLQRLDAFELDNAFFSQVRRQVNAQLAKEMTDPFPLHLYAFQISQPGMDYGSLLPAA